MSTLSPIAPAQPVAPYVGGKRVLARRLVPMIEAVPHETYAEPFVGMGGVFLRRTRRPRAEVINDLAGDVANLFRILQRHYRPFMESVAFGITSRAEFERWRRVDPSTLTDLERAARFLYLQVNAFGGKVRGRNFGVDVGMRGAFDLSRLGPRLEAVHQRLAGVTIEQLDFEVFIDRYGRERTLFYCDPPYWGSEDYYGRELFSRADFERLAGALRRSKGRFILSLNDTPEVRDLFGWARVEGVGVSYGLQSGQQSAREVIISRL